MNTRLILMPNKLSVVGAVGEQAANDASPFTEKRGDEGVEIRAQAAIGRAAALVAKLSDRKTVQTVLPESIKAVAPATSRSAALALGLDSKAKEFTSVRPSESEHLTAFESDNKLIATAHEDFSMKWAPVVEFTNSSEGFSDDDLRAVIAETGDPAEYDAESERINLLASESKSHLASLGEHVAVYSKANGADSSVQEVSERVQASLADIAPANANPIADDEDEDAKNNAGTGYGPGHSDSGSIKEAAKRALKELQKLIESFLLMLKRLLGLGTKPA